MTRPILLAAPHRLPFLVGTANLLLLALWWLLRLAELHAGVALLPPGDVPAGLLHGPAMLNLVFAPFVFGFLLTTFPRWMGYPDLTARTYGPVGALLAAGSAIALAGLVMARPEMLVAGFAVEAAAWAAGLIALLRVTLRCETDGKPRVWHAWSALLALTLGFAGLLMAAFALHAMDGALLVAAMRMTILGFLLPVFLTVAHRMVPFFAGNVVQGYVRWRPDWLLVLIWALLLASLGGALLPLPLLAAIANSGMAITCAGLLWKWWPRGPAPGLLKVLFWSLAWTPPGFALLALAALQPVHGRAADHALLIGFCASLLVAMVTRVSHGHSGRPLEMSRSAWFAFAALQLAALLRITAALELEAGSLLLVTAALFLLGLAPWCLVNFGIYLRARLDGKPG
ncbi:MAG TPA: NnrS family protein [Novosphingobium sp.]|jgi:uncharacterized protein involved in response to NO|nr:NnrS family protein [Novosphingobium sp.]HQQ08407.1 NnrS family protein [Novosphingobium sp.]